MPLRHRPWPRRRCSVLDGWPLWRLCRWGETGSARFWSHFWDKLTRKAWNAKKIKANGTDPMYCMYWFIIAPHSYRSCRWAPWVYWPTYAWQCSCTLGLCSVVFSLESFSPCCFVSSRQHRPWRHLLVASMCCCLCFSSCDIDFLKSAVSWGGTSPNTVCSRSESHSEPSETTGIYERAQWKTSHSPKSMAALNRRSCQDVHGETWVGRPTKTVEHHLKHDWWFLDPKVCLRPVLATWNIRTFLGTMRTWCGRQGRKRVDVQLSQKSH